MRESKFGARHFINRQPYDTKVIHYSEFEKNELPQLEIFQRKQIKS
jgi:hypothetical protein